MDLNLPIEQAFAWRKKPEKVIAPSPATTTEQEDALWFAGRDWRDITAQDWHAHRDAFYAFTPEAFAYYLPSVLRLALQSNAADLLPADALLSILDRSPSIENWDDFLVTRLGTLRPAECNVLKEWVSALRTIPQWASGHSLDRAFDTAVLLEKRAI